MNLCKSSFNNFLTSNNFSLIAVHSCCEAYRLAFLLNSECQCRFTHTKFKTEGLVADCYFTTYEWIDLIKGIEIRLFSNRCLKFRDKLQKGSGLFDIPETKELYLVQDLKDVDYIIKIDSGIEGQTMIEKMGSIDQVSYRYLIDQSKLKVDLSLNLY